MAPLRGIKTLLRLPRGSGRREKDRRSAASFHLPQDRVEQSTCIQGQSKAIPPKMKAEGQECPWGAEGLLLLDHSPLPLEARSCSVCANEALAGVGGGGGGRTREPGAERLRLAEAEEREAGELVPSPGIPAILGQPSSSWNAACVA